MAHALGGVATQRWFLCRRLLAALALLLVCMLAPPAPAAAEEVYLWGTLSEEDERPLFDATVRQLKDDTERAKARRETARGEQRHHMRDWPPEKRAEADEWFRTSLDNPHYSDRVAGRLRMARENRDDLFRHWQFQLGTRDRSDAWRAEIAFLVNERHIAEYEARYEQFRANAMLLYRTKASWFGIDAEEFARDTASDLSYLLASHADMFVDTYVTCVRKAVGHALRLHGALRLGLGGVLTPLRLDGWFVPETMKLFEENRILSSTGAPLACLSDTLRDSLVNAWITTFRKQFVDRVVDRGVYPRVAEYWWTKAIWDEDPAAGPEERISSQERLRVQASQGLGKFLQLRGAAILEDLVKPDRWTAVLQFQEEVKSQARGVWSKRIVEQGVEVTQDALRRRGGILVDQGEAASARADGLNTVQKAVDQKAEADLIGKAETFTMLAQGVTAAVMITTREAAYERREAELLKQYREIVACLKLLAAREPQKWRADADGVIRVYERPPLERARFAQQCRQVAQEREAQLAAMSTPKPPALTDVQCESLRLSYLAKCRKMVEDYAKMNCAPPPGKSGPGYSGCAVDPRGCMNDVINGALPCSADRARIACGEAVLKNYLNCQESCNIRLVTRQFRAAHEGALICGQGCDKKARDENAGCDAGRMPPQATSPGPPPTSAGAPAPQGGRLVPTDAWTQVSPNPDSRIEPLGDGAVRITASGRGGGSDFPPGPNSAAPRVLAPVSGSWSAEVRVRFAPESHFQGAGLLVCFGAATQARDCVRIVERQFYNGANVVNSMGRQIAYTASVSHFRVWREGGEYVASVSPDGAKWTEVGRLRDGRAATYVGAMVMRQPWDRRKDLASVAEFEGFMVTQE